MAERSIGSESLLQALHFLGERSASSKSGHFIVRERQSGHSTSLATRKAKGTKKKTSTQKASRPVFIRSSYHLKPGAIDRLASKLDVAEVVILDVSGISARTFHRRQQQGEPLTPDETDRVLRIARVAGEAERVFGNTDKARRWLARENALLGAAPLSLLATDAGSRDVEAELMRIDWGDFA